MYSHPLIVVLLSLFAPSLGQQQERKWEFLQPRPIAQVTANPGSENAFPAWYHMPPKQQHSPTYGGYDRSPVNSQVDQTYRGYPSFSRQPPQSANSNPYESPAPRRPFPQPDMDETAIEKYHKLLLRKQSTTPRTNHRRTIDLQNTVPPRLRPVTGTRPATGLPRPGEPTERPRVMAKLKTVRPIVNRIRERLRLKKILPDQTPPPETPPPERRTTEILVEILETTPTSPTTPPSTPPSFPITKDSSPWHKLSWTRKTTISENATTPISTTKARFICNKTLGSEERREREKRPKIGAFRAKATWKTPPPVVATTPIGPREVTRPHAQWTLFDILSWPNAELFNAIRDVVNKFKASLDESGLDQDVRQMGRQLQNTWQQLRAAIEQADLRRASGLDRSWNALRLSAEQSLHAPVLPYSQGAPTSMNEQLSQMFTRSQSQQDVPRK